MMKRPAASTVAFALFSLVAIAWVLSLVSAQPAGSAPGGLRLDLIKLPPGFKIELYCGDVPGARQMVLSPSGTVFVGTRYDRPSGRVYAVVDQNRDNKADKVFTLAEHLFMPNGVEFRDGSLYVAEVNRILRYDQIEKKLEHPPEPVVVFDKLPDKVHHGWKYIRFGPDGLLYVPVGAACNFCIMGEPFAGMSRLNKDGTGFESFARGIRNTVGFDWDPDTKYLWFTDNGRDWLGESLPPDELDCAPRKGMHFGFPWRYGNNVVDNSDITISWRTPRGVTFTGTAQDLDPHVAALGMRFYTGSMFPEQYRHQIFIAEHGSWNRSKAIGARVMLVKMTEGKCVGYEPFAVGWQRADGSRWGRPVDVIVMPDGALLVSDDLAGAIYRISYQGKK